VPGADFETNGQSYGMWFNVPDVGVNVLVMFADGDPNQGYYIGCIPTPQMNHMVPVAGAQANPHFSNDKQREKCAHAPQLPVTEISKDSKSMSDPAFTEIPKPIHSILAGQMWKQGIITDTVRGPIGSSSQRESPSRAYGISTPGRPIYSTGMFDHEVVAKLQSGEVTDTGIVGRRGGHSFVMDDGDINGNDTLMRFRTSAGHQITMSDTGNSIFVIHANGLSWVELGAEGTIDVYAANSINLRSGGDLNFHADHDVNINAVNNINMLAAKNIVIEATQDLSLIGTQKLTAYSNKTVGLRSDGTLAVDTNKSASWMSGGPSVFSGATIGLNSGSGAKVAKPQTLAQNSLADTVIDDTKGWVAVQGKIKSIVTRAPTHEPYAEHNTGTGGAVQPVAVPSPAVSTPLAVPAPTENPVQIRDIIGESVKDSATLPISVLSANQTNGVMAQVVNTVGQAPTTITAAGVGTYGLSQIQLETAGIIKPGLAAAPLDELLRDPAVFTGQRDINSIDDLLSNEALQKDISNAATQTAMASLSQQGLISGTETPADMAKYIGLSTKFSVTEIADWTIGNASPSIAGAMDALAAGSAYAVNLVDTKAAGVLGQLQAGIAGPALQAVTGLTGTINTSVLDNAVTDIIGSKRISL
jgi:hypothetical protein